MLLAALLCGCSAVRLGYGQAPDLVYWWLDGYADFNETQAPRVRDGLAQWFAWHRRTQLPAYADLLARAQTELRANTTPERACEWWAELRGRVDTGVERAVPAMAEVMLTLTPQQIQHIERRYAKSNEEFRAEFLQADAAQRLKESIKRAIDRAEFFYGKLDEAQRERVAKSVTLSPFDADLWTTERQRRQQDALSTLRSLVGDGASGEQAQAALRAYLARMSRSPREEYRRYIDRLAQYNCAFAASLHNSSSAAQRQAVAQKLKGWEGDLRALAADAAR
jgi:Family of unknown function (DUF6279)